MSDFNPQPVKRLQAQYIEMVEKGQVYKLDHTGEMPHDLGTLPSCHVFEFETGLQLCITIEQTPMVFIPAVIGRRRQQQAQRRMSTPDSQYLHASASWADGYLQPGPDLREVAKVTDALVEEALGEAFDQVNNGVALLRRFYAEPIAQYIDEEGFVHVLWDRYARVKGVIVPLGLAQPSVGMGSTQNGHDEEGIGGDTSPKHVKYTDEGGQHYAQQWIIDCPHCGAEITTNAGAGKRIECGTCGQGIKLTSE